LSLVSTSRLLLSNAHASPTRRHAALAFGVKITAYSSSDALKWSRTARLARSMSWVDAVDVGFSECGFPKHCPCSRAACALSWAWAGSPAPV
jgi:hypothetical protein